MGENRAMYGRHGNPKMPNDLASENKTAAKLGEEGISRSDEKKPEVVRAPRVEEVEGISRSDQKPNAVRVPRVQEVVAPPPLAAEAKAPTKFSHPAIRWPLYALGGYLILRWAWTRWKESRSDEDHKGKKKK